MLKQKRLGNKGTGTPRSEQTSQASDEMDEQDDQIAHHRIVAGREIPTNYARNNNSPGTGCAYSRSIISDANLSQRWRVKPYR